MRGKVAKRLRREARSLSIGMYSGATRKVYRQLKKSFKARKSITK